MSALAAALDALFQRPLSEFVRARDELVRELRRAGDAASAAQVKGLKRPTPAAWALNQVHFCEPALLERAHVCAAELRALHAREGVGAEALRAAFEAQRAATHAVVEAALSHGQAAGMAPNPAQQRRLLATVQGLLSGLGDEAPGRLTADLEPSGFEALAGAEIAAAAAPRAARAAEVPAGRPQGATTVRAAPAASGERENAARERERREVREPELREAREREAREAREREAREARERQLREQRRRVGELEAQLREASERVRRCARARERAHRDRAEAEARVREAEQALSALRAALAAREAEASQSDAQLTEAEAKQSQAVAALEQARAALPGATADSGQDPQPPSG